MKRAGQEEKGQERGIKRPNCCSWFFLIFYLTSSPRRSHSEGPFMCKWPAADVKQALLGFYIFTSLVFISETRWRRSPWSTVQKTMGVIHLSLAFFFLISSPVHAQWSWFNVIWPYPETTTVPPPVTSPAVTSPELSASQGTSTGPVENEDKVTVKYTEGTQIKGSVFTFTAHGLGMLASSYSSVKPGTTRPGENSGGGNQSRSKYKPLKHWKSGESYQDMA